MMSCIREHLLIPFQQLARTPRHRRLGLILIAIAAQYRLLLMFQPESLLILSSIQTRFGGKRARRLIHLSMVRKS